MYRYGLYRDPGQGWIAGVAVGLGQRFGVATGFVRLVFVIVALVSHPILAAVVYALLAVLLPAKSLVIEAYGFRRRWRREY